MRGIHSLVLGATALGLSSLAVSAQSLGLANYTQATIVNMPISAAETSAITWNWDRNSMIVLGDEGDCIVEVDRTTGAQLGIINLTGYPDRPNVNDKDTEGLTYMGNGRYALALERTRSVFFFNATFSSTPQTINLTTQANGAYLFGLNDDVDNEGLEGISYNPVTQEFYGAKEKIPMEVYRFTVNQTNYTSSVSNFLNVSQIAALGVTDLSDVQSLGTVPSLLGSGLEDNLLVLSQESKRLFELDGNGNILGSLDLSGYVNNLEGLTIDGNRNIYLVGEEPDQMIRLQSTVPEPSVMALAGVAAVGLLFVYRRKQKVAQEA